MGYMSVLGDCFGCGRHFHFNPFRVPSIRINEQETNVRVCNSFPIRLDNYQTPHTGFFVPLF